VVLWGNWCPSMNTYEIKTFLVEKLEHEKYIQVVAVHEKKLMGELEK